MKKFYSPFSSTIYYSDENKVSNHDELKDWILNLYNQSPTKEGNFYNTGFTTYFYNDFTAHLDTVDVFSELKQMILREAENYVLDRSSYLMQLGGNPIPLKELEFANMWFNVNPPGGYQGRHHHSMNLLGGTYYIDVPPSTGKIGFYDPNPFAYFNNQAPLDKFLLMPDFKFHTRAGDLLIWPGWMDHEISANSTPDSTRITVSFGINWKE